MPYLFFQSGLIKYLIFQRFVIIINLIVFFLIKWKLDLYINLISYVDLILLE